MDCVSLAELQQRECFMASMHKKNKTATLKTIQTHLCPCFCRMLVWLPWLTQTVFNQQEGDALCRLVYLCSLYVVLQRKCQPHFPIAQKVLPKPSIYILFLCDVISLFRSCSTRASSPTRTRSCHQQLCCLCTWSVPMACRWDHTSESSGNCILFIVMCFSSH